MKKIFRQHVEAMMAHLEPPIYISAVSTTCLHLASARHVPSSPLLFVSVRTTGSAEREDRTIEDSLQLLFLRLSSVLCWCYLHEVRHIESRQREWGTQLRSSGHRSGCRIELSCECNRCSSWQWYSSSLRMWNRLSVIWLNELRESILDFVVRSSAAVCSSTFTVQGVYTGDQGECGWFGVGNDSLSTELRQ